MIHQFTLIILMGKYIVIYDGMYSNRAHNVGLESILSLTLPEYSKHISRLWQEMENVTFV